ncbi:hypothetical protein [Pseudomonas sp. Irchel s3a18]|uniref:hypothetical protein n=1 Tax=Pseudomonas sp. Irchel s3a18 TaxID=2009053 RepID=UPI000BA43132|nr:hypothetical protein [Pseudomonas sp. Irchel s3a18]
MLDLTTRILLERYASNDPRLNEEDVKKQASLQVKSVVDGGKAFTVLMSSADYADKEITAACDDYNRKYPEHMSYSFQLPATMFGIPANSWVLALPERGTQ